MSEENEEPEKYVPPLKVAVTKRLYAEKRWKDAEPERDRLMRIARKEMKLPKDEAQDWAYFQLNELFPPLPDEPEEDETALEEENQENGKQNAQQDDKQNEQQKESGDRQDGSENDWKNGKENEDGNKRRTGEENGVGDASFPGEVADGAEENETIEAQGLSHTREPEQVLPGLSDIPDDWPDELPANAPLAVEIQWCQANRLRCVTETADLVTVDLSKALSPAPSYAALGWLETSIRAFTKYCDIAAKATSQLEDEKEHVRLEKLAIDRVRELLGQMVEAKSESGAG